MARTETIDVVETRSGRVSGLVRERHLAFLGIPYAKARRFAAPQPADPWSGVREAQTIGFAAPQTPHIIPGFAASGPQDEDCLNLNVFTPASDHAKRPVLVWIHGGGFTHGAGYEELYNGGPLAVRGDVVVVTFNYRLGVLGFLRLPSIGAMGNQGLLDQAMALRWVKDNIAEFGGDPANVTVFGESAGSASVGCQLVMPGSKGLFRRAVMQSGVGRAQTPEAADAAADRLLEALALTRERADGLAGAPADSILEAQGALAAKQGFGAGFGPVRCPESLPLDPLTAVRAGDCADRSILIGWNRDEVKLFNATRPRPPLEEAGLISAVRGVLPKANEVEARGAITTYRSSRRGLGLPVGNLDILDAISTDAMFRIPSGRLALAQKANGGKAWMYLFTHASPAMRGMLGACHALEMPFVFGTLDAPTQDRFAGTGPEVERLSGEMMDAWIAYARAGAPAHKALQPWSQYEGEHRKTMVFATHGSHEENDPLGDERRAIEPLI